MKKILIMIVCLGLASCAAKQEKYGIEYPYDNKTLVKSSTNSNKTVKIDKFVDYRGSDYKNQSLWDVMPLLWSFDVYNERPERKYSHYINDGKRIGRSSELYMFNLNVETDLQQALKISLENSEIFKDIRVKGYDFIIKPKLLELKYKRKQYLYGISGFSSFLAFVGIPTEKSYYSMRINYSLIDESSNKEVFTKTYSDIIKYKYGIYTYNKEENKKAFSKLFQNISNKFIYDLDVLLSNK